MHQAMRNLIKEVLSDVKANGLPGKHHFFITFDTQHQEVDIPEWLRARYPNEMTVVMQHWYEALNVTEDGFHVTLNFGDSPAPLYIPFGSLKTFVDPSVEFGLKFEDQIEDPPKKSKHQDTLKGTLELTVDSGEKSNAEVVSLDSFRK